MGTDLKMTQENLEKVCILSSMGLILLKEDNEPLWDDLYLVYLLEHPVLLDIWKT